MGLATLLDLLHSDLRRAEARAAEESAVLARSAVDAFERSFPEGLTDPPSIELPLALSLEEWLATGATRFEAPEWWQSAEPAFRGRWEMAAALPFAEAANPWRNLGAGIDGEASAVAHFLEVRHGVRHGGIADPVSAIDEVRAASPNIRTPSGMPVAVLAWRELFRLPRPADARVGSALRGAFLEDVRQRPAIWWPSLRESLEAGWANGDADWTRVVETLRRLEGTTPWRQAVARALERGSGPDFHWVRGPEGSRLLHFRNRPEISFRPGQTFRSGALYPETAVLGAFRAAADLPSLRTGSGFGVRFRFGNEALNVDGLPDASDWKPLSEAGPSASAPGGGFRVEVGLADPALYFAAVRRQVAWSGGLGTAAALALIGAIFLGRRAYLKLQDLTEAQTNFVAGVTHELRAPLASVRLLAENLQRGSDASPERRQEYYGLMVRECRRLGTLVQNVLDWSRIERGRRTYEPRRCDLPALVAGTAEVLQPQFDSRRVRLVVRLPLEDVEPAELDPDALQQALVNLLDNALKHSPEGSEVVVTLERDAGAWTLAVADSGPGIPEAEQERIFDRFHRLGSELRRETEGIGIGLSIVKHIVEGHGGRIRVDSRPGKGARFVATLPAGHRESANGGTP
jgi:signal transduction histidine kinase